jgi:hypothetical protein
MIIDLHHVRTFVAVAVTCNFTKAAKKLGCSQPTVTLHIRTLERQVGALLFERKRFSKVHALTAAGRQVYDSAVKLLNLAEELPASVERLRDAGMVITPPTSTKHAQSPDAPAVPPEPLVPGSRTFVRHSVRHKLTKVGETDTRQV